MVQICWVGPADEVLSRLSSLRRCVDAVGYAVVQVAYLSSLPLMHTSLVSPTNIVYM